MYYITDCEGNRVSDSDGYFLCADMDEVERVIYYYFDMEYGDCYHIFNGEDELVDTFIAEYEE